MTLSLPPQMLSAVEIMPGVYYPIYRLVIILATLAVAAALYAVVMEAYVHGVSTRAVDELGLLGEEDLGGELGMSGFADFAADLFGDGERGGARAVPQMRADQNVVAHR